MKPTRVIAMASLLLLCGAAPAPQDPAIGLWAYRVSYPVGLKGNLLLSHNGAKWHGMVDGVVRPRDGSNGPRVAVPSSESGYGSATASAGMPSSPSASGSGPSAMPASAAAIIWVRLMSTNG